MTTSRRLFLLCLVLLSPLASPVSVQAELVQTGEVETIRLESPHPYGIEAANSSAPVWTDVVAWPGASYIKIHFEAFDLAPQDFVIVRSPDGTQSYEYREKGHWRGNSGTFYAAHIKGDTAIVELFHRGGGGGFGYVIDHFGRGWPEPAPAKTDTASVVSPESVCGPTDWKNAACFSGTMYARARAVSRLHVGANSACTGWLFGTGGHLVTNEHCLTSQQDVNSTDFEFMGEGGTCNTNCDSWMACPGTIWTGSGTYVKDNAGLDYCLVLLAGNPQNTYGYLQARSTAVAVGEPIYIPQHPNAWGKKIADKDGSQNCEIDTTTAAKCSGGGSGDYGYNCDTAGGSSGSPILSQTDHMVIGLHHCGACPNRGLKIHEVMADMGASLPPGATPGSGCSAPGAPNLTAATATCSGVDLSWTAGSGTTQRYNVYRKASPCGGSYTKIASALTATSYSDTSAVAGTTYAYMVRGTCDTGGATESGDSNCLTATRAAAPAAPATPTFTNVACTTLTVNWTAVAGATAYDVYRRNTNCGNGTLVGANVGTTSFNDSGLSATSTYAYYVVAKNACGSSANGACTTVSTTGIPAAPGAPTLTPACTSVGLSWTAVSGATDYEVWRAAGGNCTGATQVVATTAGATTYNDTGRTAGTQYSYAIRAKNSCGTSANGTCATTTTLATPAAPTGVSATGDCNGVSVSWNNVAGATGYDVIRGTTCGTAVTTFANVTSPYADTTGTAGTAYQYWVVAKNACGNSPNSACAAGTRLACPNLVYKTGSFALTQQQGDADTAAMSPGEKWRLSFVMTNTGTGAATSASLTVAAGNGVSSANFCVNPVLVGTVGAGADSAPITADVIVPAGWAGACPSDVSFGFLSKTHAGGAAGPNEAPGTGNVAEVKKAMGRSGAGTPGSATLPAVADSYVARITQNQNFGSATFLRVGGKEGTGNSQVRGLVRFDLSSIPAGATVTSATLELTAVGTAIASRTIELLGVSSSWEEGTVTYATIPANDGTTHGSFATGTSLGAKSASLAAALVQGWVDVPATNFGIWMQDATDSNNTWWDFASREHGTTTSRPRLVVNYTTAAIPDCSAWGGTASCSAAPRPVPDGQFVSGTAMTGAKGTGDGVTVAWDVSSCAATNYNVYVGTIGNFGAFGTAAAAACGVGVSGTTTLSVAGESWWIVAGSDGATKVSSFGRDSSGAQSVFNGWGSGGQCPTLNTKDTTGTCP